MTKLKPCPFCGGMPRYTDLGIEGEFKDWAIECRGCGIVMLAKTEEGCIATKQDCINSWNRRPGSREEGNE